MNNIFTKLQLGKPGEPPGMKTAVETFLGHGHCTAVQCAFAYISLAGLRESIGPLLQQNAHRDIAKKWVIGIHNGITEPAAIEVLTRHPNSTVRIYSPTRGISSAALFSGEKLHAKALCLTGNGSHLFILGSANLTRAAIGRHSINYEAGALLKTGDRAMYAAYNGWFRTLWGESIVASSAIIDKYSQVRERFLRDNKVVLPRLDEVPQYEMAMRQSLWIEAGAMSGGDRNQVEFGPALASYFGNLFRGHRNLRMQWHSVIRADRPLSYKVTKWNTEIWRLSMITSNQGGPLYPGQIIHFTKKHDGQGKYYSVEVAETNSPKARLWRRLANRTGTLAMTGSGAGSAREYGVY